MDTFGKNDVYVLLSMAGRTQRSTTVANGGAAPRWGGGGGGETLEFAGLTEPPLQLDVTVMDEDTFDKDDLIGGPLPLRLPPSRLSRVCVPAQSTVRSV